MKRYNNTYVLSAREMNSVLCILRIYRDLTNDAKSFAKATELIENIEALKDAK